MRSLPCGKRSLPGLLRQRDLWKWGQGERKGGLLRAARARLQRRPRWSLTRWSLTRWGLTRWGLPPGHLTLRNLSTEDLAPWHVAAWGLGRRLLSLPAARVGGPTGLRLRIRRRPSGQSPGVLDPRASAERPARQVYLCGADADLPDVPGGEISLDRKAGIDSEPPRLVWPVRRELLEWNLAIRPTVIGQADPQGLYGGERQDVSASLRSPGAPPPR